MRAIELRLFCVMICLALAIPVAAQTAADPLSGSWAGDWGPNERDRNQVTVDMKLEGRNVTGTVKSTQPQRADVVLQMSTFDPATGTVSLQAEAQNPRSGQTVRYVIEGKLANGTITGSWNHDAVKGDFKLTKK